MKIRVADYIADFLAEHGIQQVFCVVGGGSMYLNHSFGHRKDMSVLYNHHEQASAMAAEAYARLHGSPALLCVTSGPGAINALNGVAGAYQDSIPMLVVSGQTKSSLTVRASGLRLRSLGNQEFDIVSALGNMTKYAAMIMDPAQIRCCLEKAYHLAVSGRPGPCWLDIPLDVQNAWIEPERLAAYTESVHKGSQTDLKKIMPKIARLFSEAERPVVYAGNGIRLAGGAALLKKFAKELQIPVVTCWDSIDLLETDSPYFCGRGGTMGDRAGNFAVQNSDFLLCIGTRLNIYQVGYNVATWARAATAVVVDIDSEELKKETIRADIPVCADAADFMETFLEAASHMAHKPKKAWLRQCQDWKKRYPVVSSAQKDAKGLVNVYSFMDTISRHLPQCSVTVVANGSASVAGSQSYYLQSGDRFLMNCGVSSMGYGLPAAIGACIANERKEIVCIEGDGSIMMNLQELQTVATNQLPIKIFVINNDGYHQIRQTQTNIFQDGVVGIGPESGDLGFPAFEKVADAFGIRYVRIDDNQQIESGLQEVFGREGACVCEVVVTKEQNFMPKSATKRLPDGTLVSPPLEDMAPFLSREELAENMYIPMIPEKRG